MYCSLWLGYRCFFFLSPVKFSQTHIPLGFPFQILYLLWLDLKKQMLRKKES